MNAPGKRKRGSGSSGKSKLSGSLRGFPAEGQKSGNANKGRRTGSVPDITAARNGSTLEDYFPGLRPVHSNSTTSDPCFGNPIQLGEPPGLTKLPDADSEYVNPNGVRSPRLLKAESIVPDEIECPICGMKLESCNLKANLHVNKCLDIRVICDTGGQGTAQETLERDGLSLNRVSHVQVNGNVSNVTCVLGDPNVSEPDNAMPTLSLDNATEGEYDMYSELDDDLDDEFWEAVDAVVQSAQAGAVSSGVTGNELLGSSAVTADCTSAVPTRSLEINDDATTRSAHPTPEGKWNMRKKQCPWYKKMPGTKFSVDAFSYGKIDGIEGYFLSHFHSDHYGGLNKSFTHGPIYCSTVTGNLVIQQLRVNPKYVVRLPMDTAVDVMGVRVTLIEANHCPGAVLFLFEFRNQDGQMRRYLHTGDFRAHASQLAHPSLQAGKLDIIYLDTTYCHPSHRFPPQDQVVEAICELCRRVCHRGETVQSIIASGSDKKKAAKEKPPSAAELLKRWIGWGVTKGPKPTTKPKNRSRTLIIVGSYTIGKEKVFASIAQTLSTKIYANHYKRTVLAAEENAALDDLLCKNPKEAGVHVVGMGGLRGDAVKEYIVKNDLSDQCDSVICIRPTGWTFRPSKSNPIAEQKPFDVGALKPSYSYIQIPAPPAKGPINGGNTTLKPKAVPLITIPLPYSEHSSFEELEMFVKTLTGRKNGGVDRVIATVRGSGDKGREIDECCRKWVEEGRRVGFVAD
ncbi:uncharacterized protein SPPG_06125 [Spizellomyces punctatus DAOM BR117]|uniref:DNA repair metallo-beta-lactamase domain-containing protein n=1 Tax=Spizellomyces punctatus (strain DAOM BR117) TaxID=645134 RepID=A0A0L0HBV7_SPIPD|nr:uncharacterized protein SPPG_06125 [Spizellomyces punctatus DAOM BR117]KNC98421.1 hypothetical protein SPPG_06125 [Spizellomyces punctatus DAOM BR117]|eukprot:XP_016606461.1 hypothetical protein SPPG_06125 [Spizellomyces punctatus DAOM BR117]